MSVREEADSVIRAVSRVDPLPKNLPGSAEETFEVVRRRIAEGAPMSTEVGVRRYLVVAAAMLVVLGLVAAPAVALERHTLARWFGFEPHGSSVTADEVSLDQMSQLKEAGAITSSLERLGVVDGRSFYVSKNSRGAYCFGVGPSSAMARMDTLVCQAVGAFPSRAQPIVELSSVERSATGDIQISRLEGVAADGVAAVGTEAASGQISWVSVAGNIYEGQPNPAPGGVVAVVAKDTAGTTVYRRPFTIQGASN